MLKKIYRFLYPRFQTLFLEYKVEMKPRYGHGKLPHGSLLKIIEAQRVTYSNFIIEILSNTSFLHTIKKANEEQDKIQPTWNNGFLPGLDIVALYTMICTHQPKRYIEVGSGNSTKVVRKAISDHKLNTKITSIDPYPRAEIDDLVDSVIRQPFENTDLSWTADLEAGDVLFIDNSHRILPNSDAMVFFMEVLPCLKKGVVVHIHDVYLPFDYPQEMCDRFYSEQYGLAFFLMANPDKYKTIFPCYFVSEDKTLSSLLNPLWNHPNLHGVEQHGGSFWLEIA